MNYCSGMCCDGTFPLKIASCCMVRKSNAKSPVECGEKRWQMDCIYGSVGSRTNTSETGSICRALYQRKTEMTFISNNGLHARTTLNAIGLNEQSHRMQSFAFYVLRWFHFSLS